MCPLLDCALGNSPFRHPQVTALNTRSLNNSILCIYVGHIINKFVSFFIGNYSYKGYT